MSVATRASMLGRARFFRRLMIAISSTRRSSYNDMAVGISHPRALRSVARPQLPIPLIA